MKKFLRSNEQVGHVVEVEALDTTPGGFALGVVLKLDGGGTVADHFDVSDGQQFHEPGEDRRYREFQAACSGSDAGDSYLGRAVIVRVDEAGDPIGYRPAFGPEISAVGQ